MHPFPSSSLPHSFSLFPLPPFLFSYFPFLSPFLSLSQLTENKNDDGEDKSAKSKLKATSKLAKNISLISRHNKLIRHGGSGNFGYYGIQRSEEVLPETLSAYAFSGSTKPQQPGSSGSSGPSFLSKKRKKPKQMVRSPSLGATFSDRIASFQNPDSPISDSATNLSSSRYESSESGSKTITDSDSEM